MSGTGWYSADLHHHSDVLDGNTEAEYVMRSELAAGLDIAFLSDHDSVVNTSHVWAIDKLNPEQKSLRTDHHNGWPKDRLDRILLFTPGHSEMPVLDKAQVVYRDGVHHTNIFQFEETREFIKQQLSESEN